MTIKELLDEFREQDNYVENSMINKSFDDKGCTFKWLVKTNNKGFRREIFISTSNITDNLEDRTVSTYLEVTDPR